MKKILGLIAFWVVMTSTGIPAQPVLKEKTKVEASFDKNNYVAFEEVGQFDEVGHSGYAMIIRLHVHRDGEQYDIDLVDPRYPLDDPRLQLLCPGIGSCKYVDKNNISFVISSIPGQKGVFYNLAERKIVKMYSGNQVESSPDGRKMAISTFGPRALTIFRDKNLAFVNDTMVFPFIEPCFTNWGLQIETDPHKWVRYDKNPDLIQKTNGESVTQFLITKVVNANAVGYLVPEIQWEGKDSITFHVKDRIGDTTATKYLVTGLSEIGTSSTKNIRVQKLGIDSIGTNDQKK